MNISGMVHHVKQLDHTVNSVQIHQLVTCVKHSLKEQYVVETFHQYLPVNVPIFNILIHIRANARIKLLLISHVMQVHQICVRVYLV